MSNAKLGDFLVAEALKSAQWERAKGELRALVALQGSHVTTTSADTWERLSAAVEDFIKEVEESGLDT
jgi:hypothetical protein